MIGWLLSFFMGLAFGSFANVCILRLPTEESIAGPRSHCFSCGHPLRISDNIPLLSYLFLRGRCHFCKGRISLQYPLVEAAMMCFFLFNCYYFHGDLAPTLMADLLAFYGITISVIDYQHRIIPDELSLSLLLVGVASAWWNPYLGTFDSGLRRLLMSVLAMLLGGGGMLALAWFGEKIFKKEAMGGGDVKLVAAFGALLGWKGLWGPLCFGSLTGSIAGLLLMAFKQKKRGDTLPFGPFLCLGSLLILFLPESFFLFVFPIIH